MSAPPERPGAGTTSAHNPSVALCMIVRDEAPIIGRCVESVRDLITSWVICDTGSTDGTPDVIEGVLGDLPGKLHHREWVDFGHNRSELMSLAKGAADYLLLLDADMTLEPQGPLPDLTADAYLLRETGVLDFANLRLVRGNRDWWYEGTTHEYLCTDGRFAQEELDALAVTHHADGASRNGKLLRDLGLLKRDVATGKATPRTLFYLAQTCKDLGHLETAIQWYRKRVEVGGWEEEVFYAKLQEGILLAETGSAEAIAVLLQAWQRRPSRAEPLYELARLHRERGAPDVAYLFSGRGLEIPYPADVLFVHRWVYEWGLRLEHAIAALALGRLDEAEAGFAAVIESGGLPEATEAFAADQLDEIAEAAGRPGGHGPRRLAVLAPSVRIGEIELDVRPSWPPFNPSIAEDGDGFRMIVRTANYRIGEGVLQPDGKLRNINYLVGLDEGLAVRTIEPLQDGAEHPRRYPSPIEGYEDCRLIDVGGRWFASATACQFNPIDRREVVLLELDGPIITAVHPLRGPQPGRHEKNWMPFVRDGALHFLYTCGPTVVLRCDTSSGRTELVGEAEAFPEALSFRGGSQGAPLAGGGWLFVAHEVDRHRRPNRYFHRFVRLSPDLVIDGVSEPFTFTSDLVEFCAGLVVSGDEVILSFGVSDAAAGLAVAELDHVQAMLSSPHAAATGDSVRA